MYDVIFIGRLKFKFTTINGQVEALTPEKNIYCMAGLTQFDLKFLNWIGLAENIPPAAGRRNVLSLTGIGLHPI